MILDFETIPEQELVHFYGGEKTYYARISNDGKNKIMRGRLIPGASIGLHTHETTSETIFYISGSGTAICDGTPERVYAGICHHCPKGSAHTVINDGDEDLVFYAVVPEQ